LYKIHGNFALALCLAQTVFLVGVDRVAVPSPDALCKIIAFLLHYLLLSTWAWMLVEGVHLYMMLVRVFFNQKIFFFYMAAAWSKLTMIYCISSVRVTITFSASPIIVVGTTFATHPDDYGTACL